MSVSNSMKSWSNSGIIQRELAYYKALSDYVGRLSFLTYGDDIHIERNLLKQYIPNAYIVWTSPCLFSRIPNRYFIISFIPPFYIHKFHSIHMVRSNQISGSWAGLFIARQKKVPFILRCGYLMSKNIQQDIQSSTIKKKITRLLERWAARQANAIIVTYPGAKKYLMDNYSIVSEKISIIGNPIDIELFSPIDQLDIGKRDILFIGRFSSEKNIHSILLACQKANASITLLGKGPLKQQMIQQAKLLKLDANFIDHMPNSNIPQLMSRHRLFIIASFYEGNPKALLEAMSCEMPCIASQIPEHEHLIVHEKEGFLAPHDADGLNKAIQKGLNNPSLCQMIGKNARKKITNDFSLKTNALKEYKLHQSVLRNFRQ